MNNPKTCPVCKVKGLDSRYKWCPYCGSWLRDSQYQETIRFKIDDRTVQINNVDVVIDKIHVPQYLK